MSREGVFNLAFAALFLGAVILAEALGETFYVTLATRVTILALAATGLNIALGLGGLVSFGHAAFFGLGGYVAGILAVHAFEGTPLPFGLPGTKSMPVIWIVAMTASALLAALVGAISLRTSGVYFIMITLAFAQMAFFFAVSWPAYGGEDGLSFYVRNEFPGLDTLKPLPFFAVCAALLGLALLFFDRLARSRFGAALQAARQNEVRLAAVGVGPFPVRLLAFVVSAVLAPFGRTDRAHHPGRGRTPVRPARRRHALCGLRACPGRRHRTLAVVSGPRAARRGAVRARRVGGPDRGPGAPWLTRCSTSATFPSVSARSS
jgi:branched-chain amino acid transport system permease protein